MSRRSSRECVSVTFFFNDTATTEIYTLSLHDALPIREVRDQAGEWAHVGQTRTIVLRSEEHTSELQSRQYLVCRLLLENKKKSNTTTQSRVKKWNIDMRITKRRD